MDELVEEFDMAKRTCSIDGCSDVHLARGYCRRHYNSWHYSGDPTSVSAWAAASSCVECGGELPPRARSGPPALYCSRSCRSRSSWRQVADSANAKRRQSRRSSRPERQCPCCGAVFVPPASDRQVYCSPKCSKRMQNANRRAKLRGAFVENLHWRMLYDEDGPACHICGLDTDPFDEGGLSHPSLDHVVPLASGGQHVRSNVRLAHRYCNSVKGAKPLEQVA